MMSIFWIVAVAFILIALSFLVVPLLFYRQEQPVDRSQLNIVIFKDKLTELEKDHMNGVISSEQLVTAKEDLKKNLLEDMSTAEQAVVSDSLLERRSNQMMAIMMALLIPTASILFYQLLGTNLRDVYANRTPTDKTPDKNADKNIASEQTAEHEGMNVAEMVTRLEARLQEEPDSLQGWVMLGRSYTVLKRFPDAVKAYEKALKLSGESNADVLTDYADALAVVNNNQVFGKPMAFIEKALKLDPKHEKALWLAGTGAFQQGLLAPAIEHWQKLAALMPAESENAAMINQNIEQAQSLLKSGGASAPRPLDHKTTISGEVSITPELVKTVQPTDTVFIFAKAQQGPPMPLAVLQKQVKDLPLKFVLSDADAMSPDIRLSQFSQVVLTARVSKSGEAMARSGDLNGTSGVVNLGSSQVKININSLVP